MVNLNKRENISSNAQRSEKMFFNHSFASNLNVFPIIILLFLISSHVWCKHLPEGTWISFPSVTDTNKMYSSSIRKQTPFQCNKKIKIVRAHVWKDLSYLWIKFIIHSKRNKNSSFSSYSSCCFQSKPCQLWGTVLAAHILCFCYPRME